MAKLSNGILVAGLGFALGACCQTAVVAADGGGTSSGGSSSGVGCVSVGSCYGSVQCPTGSYCEPTTLACCPTGGGNGNGGNGGSGGQGGTGGNAGTSGQSSGLTNGGGNSGLTGGNSGLTGGASSGLTGGASSGLTGGNSGLTGGTNGASGASSGVTGGNAGSAGAVGGANGGTVITGSCFDGGVCPTGSTCSTASWLCTGPGGGTTGSPPYYWSGSSGGGSGPVPLGTCNDGGVCPRGSTCDTTNSLCYGPGGSSGNIFGGGGSSGGGVTTAPGVGTACSLADQPGPCIPIGLFCDPQTMTCQVPVTGEPCLPTVGCQGSNVSCVETTSGSTYLCAVSCTSSAQCSPLQESCQPSQSTGLKDSTCQVDLCGDFFESCNASGSNDGTCLLPPNATQLVSCPEPSGCGSCMQGGAVPDGQSCDQTRGTNFCQTGSICMSAPSGDGNTMCSPMCSPFNGPTLCPYGYGCYWPIGSNVGTCLLLCPIDFLCPFNIGGDTPGGCSNCNFAASLLSLGTACVMDCPGSSYCQLISGTPIPACLP
jgi:hypothetical protein